MAKRELNKDEVIEYPSNSNKSKINELGIEGEKNKKIISGKVVEKKSISKEVSNSFLNAGEYVLKEILIPAIKNTLSDIVQNTLDIILFGEARGGRRNRRDNNTYISYSSISNDMDRRSNVYSYRNKIMDDIILESRADAEDVIDNLIDYIDKYGTTTIADLYELIGKRTEYTDNDWGWKDLSTARVRPVREGYLLELPRPISVK
ncbi:MAG: hypothetical protein IJ094_13125 [Bacilli bacterium]|nr:hypothetical protein [Bacilli bacterium]